MTFGKIFWPLVATATLAACSGNLGGGQSTLPGAPQAGTNVQQIAPPPATATPSSASNVATIGDNVAPQALPNILGWGGSIAFSKPAPAGSPNPKATAAATAAAPVSIGVTAGVVEPSDTPKFDPNSAKHRGKHDSGALTPLFFVSLLATSDVTLSSYPKIDFDVPRDVAAKHRDDSYALALYDPEQKDKAFRLNVAERDLSSPPPGNLPSPAATLVPTPVATPIQNGSFAFTPPPVGAQDASASLPPEHVAFAAAENVLALKANRPVVFALYVIPPQPSPSPSASPAGKTSPSPSPSTATGPSSSPSAVGGAPTPAPSASPAEPLPSPSNGSP